MTSRSWPVSLQTRFLKIKQLVVGWINYFRIGYFKKRCIDLDAWLRFRVRMCIWKQLNTPQKRIRKMTKLGVSKDRATRTAYSRKGYARIAISQPLKYALRNEIL